MIKPGKTYDEVYESFRWEIPEVYNIGVEICDRWVDQKERIAVIQEDEDGNVQNYTFRDLKDGSSRLANALIAHGTERGDRVAILLPQSSESVISHIAIYKIGAIAIPLLTLFGPDALEYRLSNSRAKVIITDDENVKKIFSIKDKLPYLKTLIVVDGNPKNDVLPFRQLLAKASPEFDPVKTKANDPALIIYTSGTTGPPKGALHAHRVLLGHIPAVECLQNYFPKDRDVVWTPADWSWIAGLLVVLLPTLRYGIPIVAHRMRKFDPEKVFHLLSKHAITNAFMPPTVLKMLRQVPDPKSRYDFNLRAIVSGGESLGEELLGWGKEVMGVTPNEIYGQTEAHLLAGSCSEMMEVKPGSIGRVMPGRNISILDDSGIPVPDGNIGEVAVKRPDPIMFLEYWENKEATEAKFKGEWFLTGDMASRDENGYIWFAGRSDDMIKSSGYRIGPDEIEGCLLKHPSVHMAGVIGSPDEIRGVIVKAYIVLKRGVTPEMSLKEDIQNFVKQRLAAYEYPREIEFIDKIPLGVTGKVMRKELRKIDLEGKEKNESV